MDGIRYTLKSQTIFYRLPQLINRLSPIPIMILIYHYTFECQIKQAQLTSQVTLLDSIIYIYLNKITEALGGLRSC